MNPTQVAQEQTLAESSGIALREEGGCLYFVDLGVAWAATTLFVTSLLAGILSVVGIVFFFMALAGQGTGWAALILLLLGAGLVWATRRVAAMRNSARGMPRSALKVLLAIDTGNGVLRDGDGNQLAPLAGLRWEQRFQIGSSSRALVASWPGGERVLVRGNPFAGGLDGIVSVLRRRGFSV